MFIRAYTTTNKKTGAKYVSHRLVESYRSEKGPRQRVVMHLGTIQLPKASWPRLAAALEARLSGHISAFEEEPEIAKATGEVVSYYHYRQLKEREKQKREERRTFENVDLASLSVVETRTLGPELIAHTIWQQLEVDGILANLGFSESQLTLAQALVIGRLLAPSQELATWLRERSALLELLPGKLSAADKHACQDVAARLLLHKEALEEALWRRELELFGPNNHLIFFGLSAIVTLAMDGRGFPIWSLPGGHELELEQMDQILERHSQKVFPTVTVHRKLATDENLELLSRRGYPYLVVYPDAGVDQDTNSTGGLTVPRKGSVQIKRQRTQEGLYIHCSQGNPEELDQARENLFLEQVDKLQALLVNRKLSAQVVQRRLVTLKEQIPSVAAHYQLELETRQNKVQKLLIQKQPLKAEQMSGYVFQTKEHPLDQREALVQYQTLTRMITAFRSGNLMGDANIFLSVLAYHLIVAIEHQLEDVECNLSWQDVQAAVSTHQRTTIILTDSQNNRHRIISSTMPEGEHHEIYSILHVEDPLKRIYQAVGTSK